MDLQVSICPTNIEGHDYVTVMEAATLLGKTPQAIYHLIREGKGENKIQGRKYFNAILVPVTEVERLQT